MIIIIIIVRTEGYIGVHGKNGAFYYRRLLWRYGRPVTERTYAQLIVDARIRIYSLRLSDGCWLFAFFVEGKMCVCVPCFRHCPNGCYLMYTRSCPVTDTVGLGSVGFGEGKTEFIIYHRDNYDANEA